MSPEALNELGVPFYNVTRLAPAVAEDKIAGDHLSVVAGHRGGDERVPTSMRISTSYSQGQLARWCGLGGAGHGRGRCRCRRAAKGAASGAAGRQRCRGAGAASARLSDAEGARVGSRRVRQCGVSA